jgi:ubiquinone/menaquinone biosynthesis C-methylase UbiE
MMSEVDKDEALSQEVFFCLSGTGDGAWEIERPQQTILDLVKQGIFHGQVLDVGCGIADNAIYIATHVDNVNITAIDLVHLLFLF